MSVQTDVATAVESPSPPPSRPAPLVRGPLDASVTVALVCLLSWLLWRVLRFVFLTAKWEILRVNFTNLLVGLFPRDALWRPSLALALSVAAVAFGAGATRPIPGGSRRGSTPSGLPAIPFVPPEIAAVPPTPLSAVPAKLPTSPTTIPTRRPIGGSPRRSRALRALGAVWPLLLLVLVMSGLTRSAAPVLAFAGLAALAVGAWSAGRRVPRAKVRWALLLAVAGVIAAVGVLVAFGSPGWSSMGGLLLTLWLAIGGILFSFPCGILLALGRRSSLPVVRLASTGYIELVRGVPLVTLLFVGQLVIGLLLPPGGNRMGEVSRALIAIVAFTAAYVAEIVRGGLQSVSKGQHDAALALGLPSLMATRLVVLPQALRAVIPALVGQFIGLFKDTSLVTTISLLELLGVAQSITNQPQFAGQNLLAETLGFASFVFWVGAYTMSRASQRLEEHLGVGTR